MSEGCVTRDLVANDSIGPQGESPDTKSSAGNLTRALEVMQAEARVKALFNKQTGYDLEDLALPIGTIFEIKLREGVARDHARTYITRVGVEDMGVPGILIKMINDAVIPTRVSTDANEFYMILDSEIESFGIRFPQEN